MLADEADNPGFLLLLEQVVTSHYCSFKKGAKLEYFMKAEKEVRGGRPDLATIYLDKVVIYAIVTACM